MNIRLNKLGYPSRINKNKRKERLIDLKDKLLKQIESLNKKICEYNDKELKKDKHISTIKLVSDIYITPSNMTVSGYFNPSSHAPLPPISEDIKE